MLCAFLAGVALGSHEREKPEKPIDRTPGAFPVGSLVKHRADGFVGLVVEYADGWPIVAFGHKPEDETNCREVELELYEDQQP
jgi:hypothetical protein